MDALAASEFQKLVADAVAHHVRGRLDEAERSYRAALRHDARPRRHRRTTSASSPPRRASIAPRSVISTRRSPPSRTTPPRITTARPRCSARPHAGRHPGLQPRVRDRARSTTTRHRALGFLWLAQGERGRALDHFARTYELRRGEDRTGIAAESLTRRRAASCCMTRSSFAISAGRRRDRQRFEILARAYEQVGGSVPEEAARALATSSSRCSARTTTPRSTFAAHRNLPGRAVSERPDRDALMRRFRERQTGAVYFDDLLTPPALARLKHYLLESTIWHDFSHIGGFVASYLEDGLACPLLLQIADEIRGTFPELLDSIRSPRPGPSRVSKRRRRSTPTPTMPPSASISGSRRMTPTSIPVAAGCGLPHAAAGRLGDQGLSMPTRRAIATFLEQTRRRHALSCPTARTGPCCSNPACSTAPMPRNSHQAMKITGST